MGAAKIEVLTPTEQLKEFKRELEAIKKQLGATGKEADKTTAKFKTKQKRIAEMNRGLSSLSSQLSAASNRLQVMGSGTGTIITSFRALTTAMRQATTASTLLGTAMKAIPIFAMIAALSTLVALFTRSEEGQNKLRKLSLQLTVLFGVFADRAATLGDMIFEAFANGKVAFEEFSTSLLATGEQVLDFFKLMGEAALLATNPLTFFNEEQSAEMLAKFALLKVKGKELFDDLKTGVGDFIEGTQRAALTVKEVMTEGLMDEIIAKMKIATDLADKQAQLRILERAVLVSAAEHERRMAEFRLRSRQAETRSFEQQMDLLNTTSVSQEIASKKREVAILKAGGMEIRNIKEINKIQEEIVEREMNILARRAVAAALQIEDLNEAIRLNKLSNEEALAGLEDQLKVARLAADNQRERLGIDRSIAEDKRILALLDEKVISLEKSRDNQRRQVQREQNTFLRRKKTFEKEIVKLMEEQVNLSEEQATQLALQNIAERERIKSLKIEAAQQTADVVAGIFQTAQQNRMTQIENDFRREILLAGDNEKKKERIRKNFEDKIRREKNHQAALDKAVAVVQSVINTAVAVTKLLHSPPLAILAGIAGAAQTAIISAQVLPKFARGGPIDGPMHSQGGVMINAEGGEFMLQRSAVAKYGLPMLEALNKKEVPIAAGKEDKYQEFIDALERQTHVGIKIDDAGFTAYQRKQNARSIKKASYYSFD
jgi:hypothetical protein